MSIMCTTMGNHYQIQDFGGEGADFFLRFCYCNRAEIMQAEPAIMDHGLESASYINIMSGQASIGGAVGTLL